MAKHTVHEDNTNEMETGNFDSILDRSADEIREPGRAPSGPWILKCVGYYVNKTKKEDLENDPNKPLASVTFYHTPYEPQEGVDPDMVEAGDWRGKRIATRRTYKERGDDAKILKLAELHGVSKEGRTLKQVLDECKGRFIRGSVSVYSYTTRDGDTVVENQIGNFAPVGE